MSRSLNKLRRIKLTFVVPALLLPLICLYLVFTSSLSFLYKSSVPQCIDGQFQGIRTGAGLGNVVFELLSFIGITHSVQRVPIFLDDHHRQKIKSLKANFPFLVKYLLAPNITKAKCEPPTVKIVGQEKCCTYDEITIDTLKKFEENTVSIFSYYLQSHRYFSKMSKGLVQKLLRPPKYVARLAQTLVPAKYLAGNNSRICVHMRLGDFYQSPLSLPTTENFTIAAVKHVLKVKRDLKPLVFGFSNEPNISAPFFSNFANFYHVTYKENRLANTEWEFSRLYCDVVILTASSSTYGWWMGYLSKGQEVFYSKDYSKPNGLEKEVVPKDFWPPTWKSLKFNEETGRIREETW